MSIKINGSNISQMRINGYDIKLAKINGSIVFEKVKLVKTFYGDSTQETTTGKNKFDYNYFFDNYVNNGNEYATIYACVLSLEPNTTYTVSTNKEVEGDNGVLFANVFASTGSNTSTNFSSGVNEVLSTSPRNVTTDENGNLVIGIKQNNVTSKTEFENGNFWIQVEKGSTATEYEPYTGGQPSPNPDYPQEVKSIISANLKLVGKNLFDVNTLTSEFLNSTNGNISSNGAWKLTGYIEIEPNENYTFGWVSDNNFFQTKFCYYDSNKNFISAVTNELWGIYCRTFTTPENSKYVRINYSTNVSGSSVSRTDIMLLKGEYSNYNSMLPYEPYKTGTIPINLQGNILAKVGDYADELQVYSNGDVKLVNKIREYTVTGEENFTNTYNTNAFDAQLLFNSTGFISGLGLCNYYKYNSVQSNVAVTLIHGEFSLQHYIDYEGDYGSFNLFFKNTNYDNATNFKNHLAELYLAGTPVKVYYPLLNPSTIQLPNIKSDLDDFGEYSSMNVEVTYG